MFNFLVIFFTLASSQLIAGCFCDCCQSVDVSVGWRRDSLDWKNRDIDSSYVSGRANSDILFKDINSYTLSAKARWVGSAFYFRCSAEYGLSDKGRAEERFKIHSPYLYYPISVETSEPIKRKSEVYDFDAAIGYPFTFFCCRLNIVPMLGFSFHRQHLRVKDDHYCCSSCCCCSSDPCCCSCSSYCSSQSCCEYLYCHSSDFYLSSSNPFRSSPSSNPFGSSSSSDPNIASELGLCNPHQTSTYRFTWYGFYAGVDIAFALDGCWTLFGEFEGHFLDKCHQKRESWTGVYFVDNFHKKEDAYGFNALVGITYYIANEWYTTLGVDFNWWKADKKHDELHWKKVGAKIGLGYMF